MKNQRINTRTLTGVAIFTAIVVVLQLLGSFIRFGTFSISLVLIPIVVGAAMYGVGAGAWLGFGLWHGADSAGKGRSGRSVRRAGV